MKIEGRGNNQLKKGLILPWNMTAAAVFLRTYTPANAPHSETHLFRTLVHPTHYYHSLSFDTQSSNTMSEPIVHRKPPTKEEMDAVFALCRNNHWKSCLQCLQTNPLIGTTKMTMGKSKPRCVGLCDAPLPLTRRVVAAHEDNHIVTTVLHQAITSKAPVKERTEVILLILSQTPDAAKIKNG
jgi:hypothetical protein